MRAQLSPSAWLACCPAARSLDAAAAAAAATSIRQKHSGIAAQHRQQRQQWRQSRGRNTGKSPYIPRPATVILTDAARGTALQHQQRQQLKLPGQLAVPSCALPANAHAGTAGVPPRRFVRRVTAAARYRGETLRCIGRRKVNGKTPQSFPFTCVWSSHEGTRMLTSNVARSIPGRSAVTQRP